MFTSFLFCSCFVAFLSTGSVSTNSQVLDYTTYSNLLALLTGNTEIASPAEQSPYLRRLPQQQRKYFLNIVALIVKQIKHFLLTFFLNRSSKTLLCKPCRRLPSIILPRVSAATIFWNVSPSNVWQEIPIRRWIGASISIWSRFPFPRNEAKCIERVD